MPYEGEPIIDVTDNILIVGRFVRVLPEGTTVDEAGALTQELFDYLVADERTSADVQAIAPDPLARLEAEFDADNN